MNKAVMTRVPLIKPDLPSASVIDHAVSEALASGRVTNFGKHVSRFEAESGAYLGASTCAVSSGTMALLFTLQALGLQRDDRVILPSFTFVASAQAVLYAGGYPMFAEVRDDLTLDPSDLARLLSQNGDATMVIGVHTYGLPCQVDAIQRVVDDASEKRGRRIPLVYDAAHAFGSSVGGRRVGTFGDAEVFSLSVTKALVTVEGGMVASRRPELIERIRKMRNYGIEANYDAHYPGLNGKMSELHAIVGLYNLERLDGYLTARQENARYYLDQLAAKTHFEQFPWPDGVVHTFKDLTVKTPPALDGRRDDVIRMLAESGVETRAYFHPPVHQQRFFARFADRALPKTEALSRRVITLPFYTSITRDEMDYVVDALADVEARLG